MRINFLGPKVRRASKHFPEDYLKLRNHFHTLLVIESKNFLRENDMVSSKEISEWVFEDPNGLIYFSNWLKEKKILNATVFKFINKDDEFVALGFDIEEDRLYTLESLKAK